MKKLLTIIVIFTLFIIAGCSGNNIPSDNLSISDNIEQNEAIIENPDFRNIKWGMTRNEVKKHEKGNFRNEYGIHLLFETNVKTLSTALVYDFNDDDNLFAAGYVFQEEHTSESQYIEDYKTIYNALNEKYEINQTFEEGFIWYDDLYKDDPNDWGFAVSLGHLKISHEWENLNTIIDLWLSGDNYKITHILKYQSKDFPEPKEANNDI